MSESNNPRVQSVQCATSGTTRNHMRGFWRPVADLGTAISTLSCIMIMHDPDFAPRAATRIVRVTPDQGTLESLLGPRTTAQVKRRATQGHQRDSKASASSRCVSLFRYIFSTPKPKCHLNTAASSYVTERSST